MYEDAERDSEIADISDKDIMKDIFGEGRGN